MVDRISKSAGREVFEALRKRCREASKSQKSRILDEFCSLVQWHRKHALRLMRDRDPKAATGPCGGTRVYDEAVKEALIIVWESADPICGKRLEGGPARPR